MIFLRFLSFLTGSFIILGAPLLLLPEETPLPSEFDTAIASCASIALLASGFFLVALFGSHMKRSPRLRLLAAVLLGLPIAAGAWEVAYGPESDDIWMLGPVLGYAIVLFISFVYPARRQPKFRPMRPRDPVDAVKA